MAMVVVYFRFMAAMEDTEAIQVTEATDIKVQCTVTNMDLSMVMDIAFMAVDTVMGHVTTEKLRNRVTKFVCNN